MKIKKWNGSAWVQDYPEVNVSSIVATGTPSGATFLRGDGTWATPADSTTLTSLGITATATELNYVDGVTSNVQTQLDNKIIYNDVLMPTNPFGGRKLYINSIDNAMHSANLKWYVTATLHSKVYNSETYPKLNADYYSVYTTTTSDNTIFTITQNPKPSNVVVYLSISGSGTMATQTATPTTDTQYSYNNSTGVITFGASRPNATIYVYPGPEVPQYLDSPVESSVGNSNFFDGNYEGGTSVPAGKYLKVKVTPSNNDYTPFNAFIGYPYGTFYGSYYYDGAPETAYLRTYNYAYAAQGIGWKQTTFSNYINTNASVSYINSASNGSDFGRTIQEFIFVAKDSKNASVTEIDWSLSRPNLSSSGSTVTKYGVNKLYSTLNLGTQTANNIILNPNGSLQANGLLTGGTIRTAVDGSATSPGISFTADTNTGIFRPAEDTLAFAEGGVEAMRITSTGTLGIGVTTTNAQLDVKDTIHITNSQNTQHGLMLENRGTYFDNTGKPGIWSSSGIGSGSFSGEGGHLIIEGRKNSARNIYVKVGDTTTPTHIFKADGNVGIGTTSPISKLHLTNPDATGTTIKLTSTSGGQTISDGLDLIYLHPDAYLINREVGRLFFRTSNSDRMMISSDGNVGIGTTSPVSSLEVKSTGATQLTITGGSASGFPLLQLKDEEAGGSNWNIENGREGDGILGFYNGTGGGNKVAITQDGKVGIGTSAPGHQLTVNGGNLDITGGVTETALRIGGTAVVGRSDTTGTRLNGMTNLGLYITPNNNNDIGIRILHTGLVGINETSPTAQLQVRATATNRVPLRLDIPTGSFENITEWRTNNNITSFVGFSGYIFSSNGFTSTTSGLYNQTSVNNANIIVPTTGAVISRNINDANPALIVNLANASATGPITKFQFNGTDRVTIGADGTITGTNLTLSGDLTINGTTTNINTINLVVEDKNIIIGDVTTPTDTTADGGGITLKGTTDKTITWVDSTDRWTSNQVFSAPNYVSTVAIGTQPYATTSTTVNTNLNADLLDGNHASAFATSTHTHGYINNDGTLSNTDFTVGTGYKILTTDLTGAVGKSSVSFGSSTTTYLRNDGTWGTPSGSGISGSGTLNQITYWTGTSSVGALSTATYPSLTELSYVKGVTSALQTQLDGKAASSHSHNDLYYTETEVNTFFNRGYSNQAITATQNIAAGWYTIATNTGDRAIARFGLQDIQSGRHQSVIFYAAHHFGTDASNTITVLHNSSYGTTPFRYIRIKENGTYEGAALQVYIDDASNNMTVIMLGDNFQGSGWVLKNWIPDATAPGDVDNWAGFTAKGEIDLDNIGQGGMATTGPIYADGDTIQYKVLTTNDGLLKSDYNYTRASNALYSDFNAYNVTSDVTTLSSSANAPGGLNGWYNLINIRHRGGLADGNNYGGQIAFGMNSNTDVLAFRSNTSAATWTGWKTIWHSGNDGSGSGLDADLLDGQHGSYYAPIASPALTGTPTAPTATAGTNTTQIATTAFVSTAVANLINSAPGALDTLDELAAALGDDANFASTVTTSLSGKVAKTGDTMSGVLTVDVTGGGTIGANASIANAWLKVGSTLGFDPNQILIAGTDGFINSTSNLYLGGGGTGTTQDLTISTGHNVGIGTTTPSEKLDVVGNIAVSGTVDGVDIAAFKTAYDSHTHDDRYYTESETDTLLSAKQATITGAASTITSSNLTAFRVLGSDTSGKVAATTITTSTLAFLDATSSIQTQLNGKAAASHTHTASEISDSGNVGRNLLTTSSASASTLFFKKNPDHTITIEDATTFRSSIGAAASSHTHTVANISDLTATATELNYVDGVTSAIQTQLNGKANTSHTHAASDITSGTLSVSRGGTGTASYSSSGGVMYYNSQSGIISVGGAASQNAFLQATGYNGTHYFGNWVTPAVAAVSIGPELYTTTTITSLAANTLSSSYSVTGYRFATVQLSNTASNTTTTIATIRIDLTDTNQRGTTTGNQRYHRFVWNNGTSTFADNLEIYSASSTTIQFRHNAGITCRYRITWEE